MSDTVKAAAIIGVCLMLGLWGAGWLSKSDVGRYHYNSKEKVMTDTVKGRAHIRTGTIKVQNPGITHEGKDK